ncbi:MAG: SseB family protein [Gammaproteobacteria bacterium]|nr:SseB family protein [Gammaproteobacteria bacterium]
MADVLEPLNSLERRLAEAQQGTLPLRTFLDTLVYSPGYILLDRAAEDARSLDEIHPLVVTGGDETPMLALFTSAERAERSRRGSERHPHVKRVSTAWVLKGLQRGVGLVVNPGWKLGFELPPDDVQRLLLEINVP